MPHYCVLAKAAAAQAEKGSASPAVWRGCCVQAAPVALTHPGSSGFQRHGVTQHPLPALLPEPRPTLTSQLLHAKLEGRGLPPPGEGFAPEVSALPLPCRRQRAAGFVSPISPSRSKSKHLVLSCSLPLTRQHHGPAITLTHHHPLALLLIYGSSSPAASLR